MSHSGSPMHPFERNARASFERQAQAAAKVIGCDVSHVIAMAAEHLRIIAENVEKGRRDDASDIRAARERQQTPGNSSNKDQ